MLVTAMAAGVYKEEGRKSNKRNLGRADEEEAADKNGCNFR